jgi:peptidoglycan/xylan/chitin deacetylase (PgdA/CDA1 family)
MNLPTPILLYHRIGPPDGSGMDKYTVSPEVFAVQMETVRREGWQPVELERLIYNKDSKEEYKRRSLAITFDDGFASNKTYAWPVLERYSYPATTFVVTGFTGARNLWDEVSKGRHALLSRADIASADPKLMTFHSHSVTHRRLNLLTDDADALRWELIESLRCIGGMAVAAGRMFAYPFGNWNWRVVEAVEGAGYIGACSCIEGLNWTVTNPFLLRRTEITERDIGWRFRLKLWTGRNILRWPPIWPSEVQLAAEWARRQRGYKENQDSPKYRKDVRPDCAVGER